MEDFADKTEAPTTHRRAEARRAGDLARSPELVAAILCLGAILLVQQFGRGTAEAFGLLLNDGLRAAEDMSPGRIGYLLGSAVGPVLLGIVLIGAAASLVQSGFVFRLRVRGISPAKNVAQMFSGRSAMQ